MVSSGLAITTADITTLEVDAIANAANTTLLGGGVVDGAIHRAEGPELLAECLTLSGCGIGDGKITDGHRLPARHVIHAVGSVWRGGSKGETKLLASCYCCALELTVRHSLHTIAFPAISCGVSGYPVEGAATVAVGEVTTFLRTDRQIGRSLFVYFQSTARVAYEKALRRASVTDDQFSGSSRLTSRRHATGFRLPTSETRH